MAERDIHLAAASLSDSTRAFFEERNFEEDIFRECENCEPTLYHATYRGTLSGLTANFWTELVLALRADSQFNGILEQEELASVSFQATDLRNPINSVPVLQTQPCPPQTHKACDVHVGIGLTGDCMATVDWLRSLGIASFRKGRTNGAHRIFSATFDTMDSGHRFFEFVKNHAPRASDALFKVKLERLAQVVRVPYDAVTLPLTYSHQLDQWLVEAKSRYDRWDRLVA